MRIISLILIILAAACSTGETKKPQVVMNTSKGSIKIELYPDKAPITVANFLRYVDEGQFVGATIYRTTRSDNDPMITVIQGGLWRPWLDGGDEEFTAPLEEIIHETTQLSGLTHDDGAISMARNEPGTASSEFFISIGANPDLDFAGERNPDGQGFAVFGKVVAGLEIVYAINAAPVGEGEGFDGQLLIEPVEIISVARQ